MACHWVEEEGLSIREAERVVESEMFLDEYPRWELGLPTRQSSFMKCSFMPQNEDGKRQNICAAEVAKAASRNPILRWINLPWSWWGIKCLDRKCGTFTTVFISYGGAQGPPLVGHVKKEKGYTGYTLLPTGPGTEADLLCRNRGSRCPWGKEGWN